ncbi:MAG: glutamine--tRNA ligase, partial [Gammaproteobacteria bacterium]
RANVSLYDRLFRVPTPDRADGSLEDHLNPESLEVLEHAALEPALANADPSEPFQFERQGYFVVDTAKAGGDTLEFLRTVSLRDSWAKLESQALQQAQD